MRLRLVIVVAVAAVLGSGCARGSDTTALCSVPSDWAGTEDARWLYGVLRSAGHREIGCTGSAFTIALGRGDLDVWAFAASGLHPEPGSEMREIAGMRVYLNRVRVAWRTCGRNVWAAAGPTTLRLPRLEQLRGVIDPTRDCKAP